MKNKNLITPAILLCLFIIEVFSSCDHAKIAALNAEPKTKIIYKIVKQPVYVTVTKVKYIKAKPKIQRAKKTISKEKPSYSMFQASVRLNRTASLVLTTSWQKVIWNGTSSWSLNGNTFPLDQAGSGKPLVNYNTSTNTFEFYNTYDVNYTCFFTCVTSSSLLTTPVTLLWRVTIPNYGGAGVDLHYPNPESTGYGTMGLATYVTPSTFENFFPLSVNSLVKTNGAYLEVALSNSSLGTITMTSATFRIGQTNSTN